MKPPSTNHHGFYPHLFVFNLALLLVKTSLTPPKIIDQQFINLKPHIFG
jgi:hypothetical protein